LRAAKDAAGIEPCPRAQADANAQSHGLPEITLPCLGGGRSVDLAGLDGPAVINFWSQTCGPCRAESPRFQQLHEAAGDKLLVLGVDWHDPRPGYAIRFAKQLGLTYPQLADPDGATRAPMHISGLPITVFVDDSGAITYTHYGAVDSVADLTDLVAEHLGLHVPTGAHG
ncbi:MAG: TlpA family protein disulfide reductase, partial [Nocardioidaceae bacterium]